MPITMALTLARTLSRTRPRRGAIAPRRWGSATAAGDLLDPTLGLSEEQRAYHELARDFAERELLPHAARHDSDKTFPEAALRQAAALGFGGMYVRAESGGTGLSRLDGTVIVEALAGADTSTTAYLTIHNMCAWSVDTFGTPEQRSRWLPDLVAMRKFAAYALTEPTAGSDAASLLTRAVRAPDGDYVLDGSKAFISGGGRADVYLVKARTGGPGPAGITCFVVEAGAPGLSFGAQEKKMGWNSQPTAAVYFDGVRVPASHILGPGGGGFKMAMHGLNGGRLSIAACSLGAAAACTELARGYVGTRRQFGKPLSANQAVQFAIADMAAKVRSGEGGVVTMVRRRRSRPRSAPRAPATAFHAALVPHSCRCTWRG